MKLIPSVRLSTSDIPNFENVLITRIIETGNLKAVIARKILSDFFLLPETRQAYNYLLNHYQKFNTTPSMELFRDKFRAFPLRSTNDSVEVICDEIRRNKLYVDLAEMIEETLKYNRADPYEALDHLRAQMASLTSQHIVTRDSDLTKEIAQARDEYQRVKEGAGLIGVPWPWPKLNEVTLGIQNGEVVYFYARPKCIVVGQRVMQQNGGMTPIEDLPDQCVVPSYTDSDKLRLRWAPATKVRAGKKSAVEVVTESGLRLRSAVEHLYMTPEGYRKASDLVLGDYVATARNMPAWEATSLMTPDDAYFLGALIGDGNFTRTEVQFTTADVELRDAVEIAAGRFGCQLKQGSRLIEYRISNQKGRPNPVLDWLRGMGVAPALSTQKYIPQEIWTAGFYPLCAFLAGLLDTDGHVAEKTVSWATSSERLAYDIQQALMRLSVRGKVRRKITNIGTFAWIIDVCSTEQHRWLSDYLCPYLKVPRKRDGLASLGDRNGFEKRNTDAIPYTYRLHQMILDAKGDKPWPRFNNTRTGYFSVDKLWRRTNRISRSLLKWLAREFESIELLDEANSSILWERVQAVHDIGKHECFDLSIDDGLDPNFVAEGFITHNSGKTWLLIAAAVEAFKRGRRPLLISKEMPTDQIRRRVHAVFAGVDYQALRTGKLTPQEEKRYFEDLEAFSENPPFILSGDDEDKGGVMSVGVKIKEYSPDIVYLDGVYLMHDDRTNKRTSDWQGVSHITQDLKRLAKQMDIPIVGTTQGNRASAKSMGNNKEEVAFSDAFTMDSDYLIRIIYEKSHEEDKEAVITIPAIREAAGCTFTIHAKFASDLSQKYSAETDEEADTILAGTDAGSLIL